MGVNLRGNESQITENQENVTSVELEVKKYNIQADRSEMSQKTCEL